MSDVVGQRHRHERYAVQQVHICFYCSQPLLPAVFISQPRQSNRVEPERVEDRANKCTLVGVKPKASARRANLKFRKLGTQLQVSYNHTNTGTAKSQRTLSFCCSTYSNVDLSRHETLLKGRLVRTASCCWRADRNSPAWFYPGPFHLQAAHGPDASPQSARPPFETGTGG